MRPRLKGSVTAPRLTSRNGMAQRARRPHLDMLLYLGGEADLVPIFHPGEKATQGQDRAHRPRMLARSRRADVQSGKTFTRAIEQWEIQDRRDGVATGRAVWPHMRRAHSHLYWTGVGREPPRVKFLLSISARGGALVGSRKPPSSAGALTKLRRSFKLSSHA